MWPRSSFCHFAHSEQPGDWLPVGSLIEPSLGGGLWLQDRPNFVSSCQGKGFSQPHGGGGVLALLGDRGCHTGHSLAPEQPAGYWEPQQGWGCPPQPWQ